LAKGIRPSPGSPDGLRPKLVIPVDLFGLPAEYDAIKAIAEKYELLVIEDSAQSFGAVYRGRKAGSLGHAAATSFFPAKPLGCYGDGGAIFTNDDDLAHIIRSLRVHGQGKDKYDNARIGINGRLDTIQAAVLLAKMEIYDEELVARQSVAETYDRLLSEAVEIPFIPEGMHSAWAQYSVLSDDRETLMGTLRNRGIPSTVYYPKPLHLQKAFSKLAYKIGDLTVAEQTAKRIFSLPMHPYLTQKEQEDVAAAMAS
jgi:UDP-2-acetamido-2-deoxy-ribo-hexuluronate aminotransferase